MSRKSLAVLAVALAMAILSPSVVSAAAPTPLALTMDGIIANPGIQSYHQAGGTPLLVEVNGISVNPSSFQYSLGATVNGQSVTGLATLQLRGHDPSGDAVSVSLESVLGGMIPSVCFPSYSTGTCAPGDTSAIPSFFVGATTGTITIGGVSSPFGPSFLLFESAYLNPFGGATLILSEDGSLLIAATYTSAQIRWTGTELTNYLPVTGAFGSTEVTGGNFLMAVNSQENLVTGVEQAAGTLTFFGMSSPALDSTGHFSSISTIPTTGEQDCSSSLVSSLGLVYSFPFSVCTLTGALTSAHFNVHGPVSVTKGVATSLWSVPSLYFTTTVTASSVQR